MATKLGDICFPLSKYTDPATGQEKTRWQKCGVLLESDKGMSIKIELIPTCVEPDGLWFKVFTDQPEKAKFKQSNQAPASAEPQF